MIGNLEGLKERASRELDRLSETLVGLSRAIHAEAETALREHAAVERCSGLLAEHGFAIERPIGGLDTAFVATLRGRGDGPTIGFLAEYDALPEIGHGCGHNLIAGSAVGAALALAPLMSELPGAIKMFGTPAEEIGVGKPAMIAAGAFADVDTAFTFHAYHSTAVMESCTAMRMYELTFIGAAAHASSDPWVGRSALDGVLLTYTNINALRQFVRDGVRIHGIVTHGGDAFNVIPERASCRIGVRSADQQELGRVVARVEDCARAAALASGTVVDIRLAQAMDSVKYNQTLWDVLRPNVVAAGFAVDEPWRALASTDYGNVSRVVPAILFSIETWPKHVAFHSREAAEHAGTDFAQRAMLGAARAMALAAIELLLRPELVERAWEEHRTGHVGAASGAAASGSIMGRA